MSASSPPTSGRGRSLDLPADRLVSEMLRKRRRRSSVIFVAVTWLAVASRPFLLARGVQQQATDTVTFSRDVAPLVREHCAACHRLEGAAPFPLLTYSQVRSHAAQIARVTKIRYMPPWKPKPGHAVFAGARRLTDEQIDVLQRWVREGAVEGDPLELSAAAATIEWELGPPDLLVQ